MLQNYTTLKVLQVFFDEPIMDHYLLEISRKIVVSHTSVKQVLQSLVSQGFIKVHVERKGTRDFPVYNAQYQAKHFRFYKRLINIEWLYSSGLLQHIHDRAMPACIVLFGSFAHGEDTEESDIDLFVQSAPMKLDLSQFEKRLHRKIQLHFQKDFRKYPKELKENIINGVVLDGFLEAY